MPRRPSANREPPAELDGDMRASDIANELRQLKFDGGNHAYNAIRIDADVRDYLVTRLTRHVTRRE